MRMSHVLLAGVAIAGAVATTSAFTASNTFDATGSLDDNAGYGKLTVTGVTVSNVAYTPLPADTSKLDKVVFTITESTSDMNAYLTIKNASNAVLFASDVTNACVYSNPGSTAHVITCETPNTLDIEPITEVGLTVVSK
ncbi:MAG: hypothetical protein AVDCRST_MAG57-1849 [uncultured Blastococcus sp.]|uniref:Uncharacterized protein n=1 Tax=uncultured Blastococcus sp. TaxID=217144 RepID=A0A6J4IDH0_9ACTN|nr:MAG: hypothetical protein AVDCRST_MAG57-1849 [uncultured Blastococcus sp.]